MGTGTTGLFRDGLVVLQVAATLVLLVAAGLMLRTLANLRAIEMQKRQLGQSGEVLHARIADGGVFQMQDPQS